MNSSDLSIFKPSDIISINYDLNQTNHHNLTTTPFEWTWVQSVLSPILGLIILGTIFGNSFVLLDFVTRLKHDIRYPTPTHFFIANLALADFLVGILVLPFLATLQVTSRWYFSQYFCTIWICTHFWLCAASILSTCAVCIERFIGVKYPIQHMRILNTRRIIMGVITVWILAGIPSVIRVFAWTNGPNMDKESTTYECKVNQNIGHAILAAVGIFYLPASIMIVLYWKILRIASNHFNMMKRGLKGNGGQRYEVNQGSIKQSTDGSTKSNSSFSKAQAQSPSPQTVLKKQINLAKRLVVLVGIVLFSYGPYFTLILMRSIDPLAVNPHVFDFFAWTRYFNSCINPFIYAYAVPYYRKAFKRRMTIISRGTLST